MGQQVAVQTLRRATILTIEGRVFNGQISMGDHDTDLDKSPGIAQAYAVLRERMWLIVLCAVVSLGAAIVYVEHKQNLYTATASLQFTQSSLPSQVAGVSAGQALDPEGEKSTNVQLVTTTPVASEVLKALNLRLSPAELLGEVSASDPQNDYVVDIDVTDPDAALAAKIANAFARQYVIYSQKQNEEQLVRGQSLISEREARLPADDTADRESLKQLSQKLLLLQSVASANARVVSVATPPGAPSSPHRKTTAIVALMLGLLLGTGLAVLLHVLSQRISSIEDFERYYGMPALAATPRLPHQARTREEREDELEPFRMLRNGLTVLSPSRAVRTVLVSSAVSEEGKTTVAIGLARAAALAGGRVVLVEADLRRPSFADRLRIDGTAPGLIAALLDGADPLDHLQYPAPELPRLQVLPAGPVRPDAASRLRPFELTRVIDSAPLLPVVDTRVLLDELDIDSYLVVCRSGFTVRDDVKAVRALFERRGLNKDTGIVVNGVAVRGADYYYFDTSGPSSGKSAVEERQPVARR
jgi:succinoglycan biosynthesis transport protein ExoP